MHRSIFLKFDLNLLFSLSKIDFSLIGKWLLCLAWSFFSIIKLSYYLLEGSNFNVKSSNSAFSGERLAKIYLFFFSNGIRVIFYF